MTWTKLSSVINANASFLISSHVSPDGDCIGSQLAMYWYLAHCGKHVEVFNADPVPRKLAFLDNADVITTRRPAHAFDVLVVLDSSNPDRLGWESMRSVAPFVVNIDHHADNTSFADLNIVDSRCAATGQILYQIFEELKVPYPAHVAQALYTAIMTDTGGFRFSNTDGKVLHTCASLCDRGADCAAAYTNLYASDSQPGLILKSRIWSTLSFHLDGKVCAMEMPMRLIEEVGAEYGDSEGMADCTITGDGVEVGMLIKHTDTESHFSLRSTGSVDVGKIARAIVGGGGHGNAAGCTLQLPLKQAKEQMLSILKRVLGHA